MLFHASFNLIKNTWPQWIATLETFLMSAVFGMVSGWTTPSLVKLQEPNSPIKIDKNQASWIVSLLIIGRIIGFVINLTAIQYMGSKAILHWIGKIKIIGLIFLAIANSVLLIYISRLICGIAFGMFTMSFPLYIGEISNQKIRGRMVIIVASGLTVGFLLGLIVANYMTILSFSLITLFISTVFVCSFTWLPESPYYLVKIGKLNEAAISIKYYQRDADVPVVLESLQIFVNGKQVLNYIDMFRELMVKHNKRALINLNIFHILSALSGSFTMIYYLQTILIDAKVTIINPDKSVIALTLIGLVGEIGAIILGDKLGRKVLLCVSLSFVGLSFIIISIHFGFINNGYNPINLQALPITAVIIFTIFVNFGLVSIPSVILSELFAQNVKTVSVFITNIVGSLAALLSTLTYQFLLDEIGSNLYFFYALILIVATLFVVYFMPETRGKSLQEIQEMLKE